MWFELTFFEEDRASKTEWDGSNGVEKEENQDNWWIRVVEDCPCWWRDAVEQGHERGTDCGENEILEEPGGPV